MWDCDGSGAVHALSDESAPCNQDMTVTERCQLSNPRHPYKVSYLTNNIPFPPRLVHSLRRHDLLLMAHLPLTVSHLPDVQRHLPQRVSQFAFDFFGRIVDKHSKNFNVYKVEQSPAVRVCVIVSVTGPSSCQPGADRGQDPSCFVC